MKMEKIGFVRKVARRDTVPESSDLSLGKVGPTSKGAPLLAPLSRKEECKECAQKFEFIQSLKSELLRLQNLANDLTYQLMLKGVRVEDITELGFAQTSRCGLCNALKTSPVFSGKWATSNDSLNLSLSSSRGKLQSGKQKLSPIQLFPSKFHESDKLPGGSQVEKEGVGLLRTHQHKKHVLIPAVTKKPTN